MGKGRKPFLYEAAVEKGVMGDDEYDLLEQIVDGLIVNALISDHRIDKAGYVRDFGLDREARIFEPLPRTQNPVDPTGLTVILEEADAETEGKTAAEGETVEAAEEEIEMDDTIDDEAPFIEEQEEGDEDVTDIIGDVEDEEEP